MQHLFGPRRYQTAAVAVFFFVSDRRSGRKPREELANLDQLEGGFASMRGHGTEEQRNKFLVLHIYKALNNRDHATVHSLLASDLEWWFHGPPAHQHMMRLLTGNEPGAATATTASRARPRSPGADGGHDGQ
ncbi:uncharacterized protein LOC125532772 [Triticum urartu]|uniref:uncharacterized protein LOC125532770 n=1 Tax=Triticum urartu TaxID=4572 RepID=UPI0020445D85|nr:uncharacterized protein LOC125532770 [Triticum urartu]XP_048552650.1 uncharacterized protein LOC125532772 [Triticum urartu]